MYIMEQFQFYFLTSSRYVCNKSCLLCFMVVGLFVLFWIAGEGFGFYVLFEHESCDIWFTCLNDVVS